jgi:DNA-binding sugar fermentation-stimulating protein
VREEAQVLEIGSPTKTAEYIYAHLQDLTRMARQNDLAMLVYLLEMAQIEAMEVAKQIRPTRAF